jgi:tetratricopeptide (TPR) repeat protein
MKKISILVIMFFALFSVSDTVLANENNEYETALHYYNSGKYKEAIRLFKDYAKEKPDSSVYYYIGYALYKTKKFDEANKYFKMAYDLDPMFSPKQIISVQKHETTQKEIKEQHIEKDTSKIPSLVEKEAKQTKGEKEVSIKEKERVMLFLTLIYVFAHKKV